MIWQSYHRKLLALSETEDSLTDSQRKACQSIQQAVEDYEQRINLWGSPGTGKTFLAHYLHHRAEGLYFCSAEYYRRAEVSPNSVIIIDNAPHDRKLARVIVGDILWSGAISVILITRQPINDAIRKIHLSLVNDDIEQIKRVISQKFGQLQIEIPDEHDFQQSDKASPMKPDDLVLRHFVPSGIWTLIKALAIAHE